jgi:hypothetical protein
MVDRSGRGAAASVVVGTAMVTGHGAGPWQRLVTNLHLVDDPDARLKATARANIAA